MACIHFCVASLFLVPFVLKDGGALVLGYDFGAQEIPLNMLANQAIKSGEVLWNWKIDIGSDFLTALSFYNLGSPFFWLSLLFPADWFPFLTGALFLMKYTVAGLLSFLWLRRHCTGFGALCGSLLYAFSGFQLINQVFFHFHDVTAFFPLLLLTLDDLVAEGKRGRFLFAVALCATVNYVFFFGEALFLVIYFFVRYVYCNPECTARQTAGKIGLCVTEGLLGTGLSAVLLFPSLVTVLNNPRLSETGIMPVYGDLVYLQMLRALVFPAENMGAGSAVLNDDWYSLAIYLPLAGFVPACAWILKKKKARDWLNVMLLVCLVFAVFPVLNSAFLGFGGVLYRRWFFMPVLMLALASGRVLEDVHAYPLRAAFIVNLVLMTATVVIVMACRETMLYIPWRFYLLTATGYASVLALFLITRIRYTRLYKGVLVSAVCGCAVFLGLAATFFYRQDYFSELTNIPINHTYDDIINTGRGLENRLPYRYHFWEHYGNRGMAGYVSEKDSFLSTVHPSVFSFYEALDVERTTRVTDEPPAGVNELLSVRYYVRPNRVWIGEEVDAFFNSFNEIVVYRNDPSLPIGFGYDAYMTKDHFRQMEKDARPSAMLRALVVDKEDEETVSRVLTECEDNIPMPVSKETLHGYVRERGEHVVTQTVFTTEGLEGVFEAPQPMYVFYSIPWDKNWHAYVDGAETKLLNINGLSAHYIDTGEHAVTLRYIPVERYIGLGLSVLSLLLSGLYLRRCKKRTEAVLRGKGK